MYRDFDVCPHCTAKGLPGKVWKLLERTPNITVSDGKTFHLLLFSGPDPIPAPSGGIVANRLAAQFSYLHDGLGGEPHRVAVLLTRPGESFESVKDHLERAATKIGELLERGKPLCAEYGFDGEHLWELTTAESAYPQTGVEPIYMNGKGVAKIGHVVMTPGYVRAIVTGISGTFVKVRGIATKKDTGETIMLDWVHDLPASECVLLANSFNELQ